jgi:predicted DNA-binding transcriptional regulator AlpA
VSLFDQQLLTVPELAGYLRVSTGTVYRNLKDWPHIRITDTDVRFSEANVEAILALKTKTPTPPRAGRSRIPKERKQ